MNRLSNCWRLGCSLLFGLCVLLYWWLAYPAMTAYQEQYQLLLFDAGYLGGLFGVPGGGARLVGEFLVQYGVSPLPGAVALAVVYVLVQRVSWRVLRGAAGVGETGELNSPAHYALSFVPAVLLWLLMGDESVLMTFAVALLAGLTAMWGYEWAGRQSVIHLIIYIMVCVPAVYWLAGPVVLMTAGYVLLRQLTVCPLSWGGVLLGLLAVVWAVACVVGSAWLVPYPVVRLFEGLDYYRFVEVWCWPQTVVMLLCALLPVVVRWLPVPATVRRRRLVGLAEAGVLVAAFVVMQRVCYDDRKYEVMEYDYLVRQHNWDAIIAKAERKTPDLPMSVCATNLALGMKGLLGERAFDFYQHGMQGLLPAFERNFSTILLTGEAYWQLGLVNTAQRFAFEAMEGIPNYHKSSRAVMRLAETNLVNGQYAVARKYLQMLEKTLYYRRWARRLLPLLGNEQAISQHPVYGRLRQLRLTDDFLFSEQELDKIMGQLLMHNHRNGLALQYLLLCPLLERDINKFMNYMTYVDGLRLGYRPRSCQEAIAFAFAQRQQQPPQGYVSPLVLSQFGEFARAYGAGGGQAASLSPFVHTTWYYLVSANN